MALLHVENPHEILDNLLLLLHLLNVRLLFESVVMLSKNVSKKIFLMFYCFPNRECSCYEHLLHHLILNSQIRYIVCTALPISYIKSKYLDLPTYLIHVFDLHNALH